MIEKFRSLERERGVVGVAPPRSTYSSLAIRNDAQTSVNANARYRIRGIIKHE